MECGIQRAVVDQKLVSGLLFKEQRNPVGMVGRRLKTSEDQDLKCALKELKSLPLIVYRRHSIYIAETCDGVKQKVLTSAANGSVFKRTEIRLRAFVD